MKLRAWMERPSVGMGAHLRAYRRGRGIGASHVARKVGKPASSFYALEAGEVRMFLDDYVLICDVYGLEPGEFLTLVLKGGAAADEKKGLPGDG